MSEDILNRLKAERCTPAQIREELRRIDKAIAQMGYLPGMAPNRHVQRYQKRRAVYARVLEEQVPISNR